MAKKQVCIRLVEEKIEMVKRIADESKCNFTDVVSTAVDCYVEDGKHIKRNEMMKGLIGLYKYSYCIDDEDIKIKFLEDVEEILCLL